MDTEILRLMNQYIFIGVVSTVNGANGTATVTRPDMDGKVSAALYVLQRGTHDTKEYWMPAVGDQVLCVLLPNTTGKGPSRGCIVGAIYSAKDGPVESNPDARSTVWPDGSFVKYDGSGNISINAAGSITLTAPRIDIN